MPANGATFEQGASAQSCCLQLPSQPVAEVKLLHLQALVQSIFREPIMGLDACMC